MQFIDFIRAANTELRIIGTNSLIPHLEDSAAVLANSLVVNPNLRILILCESDNENFSQSLCTDTPFAANRASFTALSVHRDRIMGTGRKDGLVLEVSKVVSSLAADDPSASRSMSADILNRIDIKQLNLRLPVNLIQADGCVWCSIVTNSLPTIHSYFQVGDDNPLKQELLRLIDFYTSPDKGGVYLSRPREELIQLYDKNGIPRGIFPRTCFYTTEFSRYSIWGFVFNRKGKLLLHQRSKITKDGRNLWDKSIGGHVDLQDSSTSITAERELIEEMFLPKAEFTPYLRADLGDIINYGDWNPKKRPEREFLDGFANLSKSDWVMFRATDSHGTPLTETRISERRIQVDDQHTITKRTVFKSDLYLFIAPLDFLDTDEQMREKLKHAEESGAAQAHRLVSIDELRHWITDCEQNETEKETFTDDILFINLQYRELLEGFAEFVKFLQVRKR